MLHDLHLCHRPQQIVDCFEVMTADVSEHWTNVLRVPVECCEIEGAQMVPTVA